MVDSNPADARTVRFYVYPAANGSAMPSFETLDDALCSIRNQYGQAAHAGGHDRLPQRLKILYTDRFQDDKPQASRPTYQYYVDATPVGTEGDGSELAPWASIDTALSGIGRLHGPSGRTLQAGECICLAPRDIFTPTPLERHKQFKESVARYTFLGMAMTLVIPVIAILVYLLVRAWPALSLEFLLTNPRNRMTAGGIWAPLMGTYFLVLISLLVASPIGVLAGIYLNEYARDNWFTRIINLAVVNLAGVPSIVHALFGVGAFVLFAQMGKSLLAASCTLAVMTLPVIITSTREALASVPVSFREACWNMGATRWQTIRTIVLPNSMSGILTGLILQVARAAGETAPILFTGAVFYTQVPDTGLRAFFPYGLHDTCMALSMHLFTLSTQVPNVPDAMIYGTAVVLIGLVLFVNSMSIGLRVYLRSRKKW
jgi:phosphate transport system permease protein